MTPIRKGLIRERLYRRRFVVPNAVTVGNMFCGFLAILYASSGRFQEAIVAVGIAIVLDGVDGRVARKLNATSQFGLEFDSLSDVISFGVAPAILAYHWGLKANADDFGVVVSFVYLLCTATRLARFNSADHTIKGFSGLPSPGAAGVVLSVINLNPHLSASYTTAVLISMVLFLTGFLMVSRFEFTSLKHVRFRVMPVQGRIMVGSLIVLLWYAPRIGLCVFAVGYALSGVLQTLMGRRKNRKLSPILIEDEAVR